MTPILLHIRDYLLTRDDAPFRYVDADLTLVDDGADGWELDFERSRILRSLGFHDGCEYVPAFDFDTRELLCALAERSEALVEAELARRAEKLVAATFTQFAKEVA